MDTETVLCSKARNFRELARQHWIGSNMERDLDYIARQRDLHACSTFQKQDNLLLPSPSKLLHETSFSISVGSVRDIHTAPSQQHVDPSTQVQVSARQLGVSSHGIERNLPPPPRSVFLYSGGSGSTSDGSAAGSGGGSQGTRTVVLEPEYVGLLLRSYMLSELNTTELRFVSNFLFSLSQADLVQVYQQKASHIFTTFLQSRTINPRDTKGLAHRQQQLSQMTDRSDLKLRVLPDLDCVRLSSFVVTFNSNKTNPLTLGREYVFDLHLRNRTKWPVSLTVIHFSTKKADLSEQQSDEQTTEQQPPHRHGQPHHGGGGGQPGQPGQQASGGRPDYDLEISPSVTQIRKGGNCTLKISFRAHRPIGILDELIVLSIVGGRRIYLCLHVYVESKVFGISPELLELVPIEGIGHIPRVLDYIKSELLRKGALHSVGIFRKAGHERRMTDIKREFDQENYIPCQNVNDFATLIKVWFRSLPQKVFSFYPTEYFQKLDAHSPAACLEALNGLPLMSRNLLNWLLSFMVDVVEESDTNKMTSSNLAICFSPNLYKVNSKNPGVLMMMTSKMSQFFQTLVELREAQEFEDFDSDESEEEGDLDDY